VRSSLPDVAETFGQNLNISVPQLDVVRSSRTRCKTNGLADNKRRGFRFGFADALARRRPTVATVKKLVRQFMRERRELLGRGLARKKGDAATVGCSAGRRYLRGILDGNALRRSKGAQPRAVLARITFDRAELRKFFAIGLTDILSRDSVSRSRQPRLGRRG
jgi:hypothetical protein